MRVLREARVIATYSMEDGEALEVLEHRCPSDADLGFLAARPVGLIVDSALSRRLAGFRSAIVHPMVRRAHSDRKRDSVQSSARLDLEHWQPIRSKLVSGDGD